MSAFLTEFTKRASEVEANLKFALDAWNDENDSATIQLVEAMSYSALGPGKRVRPVLSMWTAEACGGNPEDVLPWAAAIEMIHTYSLIHDDLPCMDDDDERRGRPTNHVMYGESTALLAGDALLTEAFGRIADGYAEKPLLIGPLVSLLARAAGVRGMVGGQAVDLASVGEEIPLEDLRRLHERKTGALIAAAVQGAAIACNAPMGARQAAKQFGGALGLAFQIADDLLDAAEDDQKGRSYVDHLGIDGAKAELDRVSDIATAAVREFPKSSPWLSEIVEWNRTREK